MNYRARNELREEWNEEQVIDKVCITDFGFMNLQKVSYLLESKKWYPQWQQDIFAIKNMANNETDVAQKEKVIFKITNKPQIEDNTKPKNKFFNWFIYFLQKPRQIKIYKNWE